MHANYIDYGHMTCNNTTQHSPSIAVFSVFVSLTKLVRLNPTVTSQHIIYIYIIKIQFSITSFYNQHSRNAYKY